MQGPVLYSVSHAHDCSDIGAYDDPNPRTWRHALAETVVPSGNTLLHNNNYPYSDFAGLPTNTLLHWFPELSLGKFTGQNQAAWSVSGNANYVVLGGEFPKVNGVAQQGLVRFALPSVVPSKAKPLSLATLRPTASSPTAGTARVRWQSTWDYDNASITYRLYRDSGTTPVYTTTVRSTFWDEPWLGFLDTGLPAGGPHTYRITATDPDGNVTSTAASSAVTIAGTSPPTTLYDSDVTADGATQCRAWPSRPAAPGTATPAGTTSRWVRR